MSVVKIEAPTHAQRDTRERVLSALLDGPVTTGALAARLGLTPAGVRRHLDALADEGLVEAADRPPYGPVGERGRGRPARVFSLTALGRDSGGTAYDQLALGALDYLERTQGPEGVRAFAHDRLAELRSRMLAAVEAAPAAGKASAAAAVLTAEGYAASTTETGSGVQLCQHRCPVAHVAERFPALCEAETEALAQVLGTHVQRLATIAHGDQVCTTFIPSLHPGTSPDSTTEGTAR